MKTKLPIILIVGILSIAIATTTTAFTNSFAQEPGGIANLTECE